MKLITKDAIQDVIDGAKNYEFWMTFGMNDIKAKYRRSKLGQLWITLSVAVFILVIGGLYQRIFGNSVENYLAYLCIGYVLWLFISDTISTAPLILSKAKIFLLQREYPISLFVFRHLIFQFLTTLHHLVLIPIVLIYCKMWPGLDNILLAFAGFGLIIFTGFWAALLIAILALRFPDISPILQSIIRLAFFATPVFWIHRDLGNFGEWVLALNPFKYYLSIVRDPILYQQFALLDWIVTLTITGTILIVALALLSWSKHKITYWL